MLLRRYQSLKRRQDAEFGGKARRLGPPSSGRLRRPAPRPTLPQSAERRVRPGPQRPPKLAEDMSEAPSAPSPEKPLQGGCLCGAVRYEITAPFLSAGYCHCTHCQRRTGTGSSANGRVPQAGFRLLSGQDQLRPYQPPTGVPKLFCTVCGSALFSGEPLRRPRGRRAPGHTRRRSRDPTPVPAVRGLGGALGADTGRRRPRAPSRAPVPSRSS